jgi:hypothetical protein
MPNRDIVYRDLEDKHLISFCENNMTENAYLVLGVFRDTDGKWKVENENYAYLVKVFFEAKIASGGMLNGKIDFKFKQNQTDSVM